MAFWKPRKEREMEIEQALQCVEAVDMSLSEMIALIDSDSDDWVPERNIDRLLDIIKTKARADQALLRMAAKRLEG